MILAAFDKLNSFYRTETSASISISIDSAIQTKYFEIESQIGRTLTTNETETSQRIVPIQLTAERLSEFLGAARCVWVIEDFHKVKDVEKKKLSQVLKVFMDTASKYPDVKVICLGAVGTARELIAYDKELSNRVTESYVPLMSDAEIREIVSQGFRLMNIKTPEEDLIEKIIHYSNNLAAVCHQLCYDICYSKNICESSFWKKEIDLKDFEASVKMYIRKVSDTFNSYYEKISGEPDLKEALTQVIGLEKDMFDGDDILKDKKRLSKAERDQILMELTTLETGELLRYNLNAKKFSFSNPFFQAFLKMQFAVERAKKQSRKKGIKMELFNDIQYSEYFQIISEMIEHRKKIIDEFEENIRKRKK
ncbi:hypothetical protein [Treponema vincentii]|uniref:hypothetical protein n=1 Tax=Treponema vincentii TaxID=69710 RepID=UPI003D926CCD